MSLFANTLGRNSLHLNLRLTPCRSLYMTNVRYLFAPSALGIDGYLQTRKRSKEQFASFTEKFRTKMNDFVADSKNMIFTEDLKNMVHLAEPTDLELITKMIKKFNAQQSEYRFGSFVFGPVVMRMYHFLDAPKEALESYFEPRNDGFFDQTISCQILLDLLYSHEMYDDMYKVFEKVQEKQMNMTKYPKYCVVLILAACYKQNTPKSLEYASHLWSEMNSAGNLPLRRACVFFAALALKQGSPHAALESLSNQKQHYVTIRNIKAMALADLGRADDTLPILRSVLEIDSPTQKDKHTFFAETIDRVRQAVEKTENKDIQKEFNDIYKALNDRGLIENKTIDQLLNTEIQLSKSDDRGSSYQNRRMPFGQRRMPTKNLM
ncbi:pentatricopeptide repeat-containing protein 2, mitochondrial-like [Anticarsia gemmatalis]|uniref:pentatricopeptide repeat-containing protein 2, mitochondrial-like n=1 Tax=Anticarsia gemmatalis TaxID=129554 RepID=UPI003F75C0EC